MEVTETIYCKQCGFDIVQNVNGYCSKGCQTVAQRLKEWDEREARQEGR